MLRIKLLLIIIGSFFGLISCSSQKLDYTIVQTSPQNQRSDILVTVMNDFEENIFTYSIEKASIFDFEVIHSSEDLITGGKIIRIATEPGMCFKINLVTEITEFKTSLFGSETSESKYQTIPLLICDPILDEENRQVAEVPEPVISMTCNGVYINNPGTTEGIMVSIMIDGNVIDEINIHGGAQASLTLNFHDYETHTGWASWYSPNHPAIVGDIGEIVDLGQCLFPTPIPAPTTVPVPPTDTAYPDPGASPAPDAPVQPTTPLQ